MRIVLQMSSIKRTSVVNMDCLLFLKLLLFNMCISQIQKSEIRISISLVILTFPMDSYSLYLISFSQPILQITQIISTIFSVLYSSLFVSFPLSVYLISLGRLGV